MAFLVLLLLGLSAGGNLVPWSHPLVLATLPLAAAALVGFVAWEARVAHPIIPVRLLARRTVLAACLTNLAATMAATMAVFYVPLYLQVLGFSAADAGLRLVCSPLGVSLSSVAAGFAMKRTGRYLGLGVASMASVAAAFVLATAALSTADPPVWAPFAVFFLLGAGYGAMLTIHPAGLYRCRRPVAAGRHHERHLRLPLRRRHRRHHRRLRRLPEPAAHRPLGPLRRPPRRRRRDRPHPRRPGELQRLPAGWHDGVIESFADAFRGVWLTALGWPSPAWCACR